MEHWWLTGRLGEIIDVIERRRIQYIPYVLRRLDGKDNYIELEEALLQLFKRGNK